MQVRVLGPFRLEDGGQRVTIGGVRQCAVLARLLLQANEVVPSEQLLVDLWGENSPPSQRTLFRRRSHGCEESFRRVASYTR